MQSKAEQQEAARDAARAAWESATVQNLGPLLTADDSTTLWEAIVAFRESGDPDDFTALTSDIAQRVDAKTRAVLEQAVATIPEPDKE